MRRRFVAFIGALVVAIALFGLTTIPVAGQAPAALGTTRAVAAEGTLTTPWGAPDLQGIWTQTERVPMQRAARYKGREFLTAEEIATRDAKRAVMKRRSYREKIGTYIDVAAAYGAEFSAVLPTGRRTGMIVDPSDGKMPPFTPEALKRRREIGLFVRALLQATPACKNPHPPTLHRRQVRADCTGVQPADAVLQHVGCGFPQSPRPYGGAGHGVALSDVCLASGSWVSTESSSRLNPFPCPSTWARGKASSAW